MSQGDEGVFLIRIEDTDQKRSSEGATASILEDLQWLGLGWDEGPTAGNHGGGSTGPYFQSQRTQLYRDHLQKLLDTGQAYRAFETTQDLAAARALARSEKRAYKYDRAALSMSDEEIDERVKNGDPHVVRFRVPNDVEGVTVIDEVLGEVTTAVDEVEDFVIFKADGFPTYHFAVVLDDASMNVTHVVRGQEHLANTVKHQLLQDALGLPRPVYAHLPLIFNPDGSKMSKRDRDKSLRAFAKDRGIDAPPLADDGSAIVGPEVWEAWMGDSKSQLPTDAVAGAAAALGVHLPEVNVEDFRAAGYLPEVLINALSLLGWSPGGDVERFDAAFLVEHFSLDRVLKSAAKFDRPKLLAFNQEAIAAMDPEHFQERLAVYVDRYHRGFCEAIGPERFVMLCEATQPRSRTLAEAIQQCGFLDLGDDAVEFIDSKSVRKAMQGDPSGGELLASVRNVLAKIETFDVESIEAAVAAFAEANANGKIGKVAQPLRIAVTGTTVSPPIGHTLALLGRASTLARIDRCLDAHPELQEAAS